MVNTRIYSVTGREILDSRGNPTVEVLVILESGYRFNSSVPSGASKGTHEALELRDKDENRYGGMGVLKVVNNINKDINNKLKGMDALNQDEIDDTLINLDGTPNKSRLGANAILGTSMAVAGAASMSLNMPLYKYINFMFSKINQTVMEKIPTPMFNIINGGLHGGGNLNFQEFLMMPASSKPFHEALEIGANLYRQIKKILIARNAIHSVGDEGGYAPNLYSNMDALEIMTESVKEIKLRLGFDVFLGLDLAANSFASNHIYTIRDRNNPYNRDEFIDFLVDLQSKYRLLTLEDPLEEGDWEGWRNLTNKIGQDVLIIGDDLLVTNPTYLEKAIKEKACSALLAKPNQIGSLSEYFKVIDMAKKNNIKVIVSHRSAETTDSFISDLAVGLQSDYVKFGAPARGERVAKYNRLSAIETELFPYDLPKYD